MATTTKIISGPYDGAARIGGVGAGGIRSVGTRRSLAGAGPNDASMPGIATARPSTSNTTIPHARHVEMVSDVNRLDPLRQALKAKVPGAFGSLASVQMPQPYEADGLEAGSAAFVLGPRSDNYRGANGLHYFSVGGPTRMDRLCSFDMLNAHLMTKNGMGAPNSVDLLDAAVLYDGVNFTELWDKAGGAAAGVATAARVRKQEMVAAAAAGDKDTLLAESFEELDERMYVATRAVIRAGAVADAPEQKATKLAARDARDPGARVKRYTGAPARTATLLNMGDLAKLGSEWGSELMDDPFVNRDTGAALQVAVNNADDEAGSEISAGLRPFLRQGVFTLDQTCFLRGKGLVSFMGNSTKPSPTTGLTDRLSRTLGDEVAFGLLHQKLVEAGCFDWSLDGVVLSKATNDPDDMMSDRQLDGRDGALFNVAIGGPATFSDIVNVPMLATLPGDSVYVLLLADVVIVDPADGANAEILKVVNGAADMDLAKYNERKEAVRAAVTRANEADLRDEQKNELENNPTGGRVLTNFRVRYSTSAEMLKNSNLRYKADGSQADTSRLGLKLGTGINEVVVGGWHLGVVLDNFAKKHKAGVLPSPANTGCLRVAVDVRYLNGDQLYRKYANVEDTVWRVRGDALTPRTVADLSNVPPYQGTPRFIPDPGTPGASIEDMAPKRSYALGDPA